MADLIEKNSKVAIVGGGLVGALQACILAKHGYEVDLYEYREDIRNLEHVPGKSINLAMSIRGLSALNSIGLGNHVAEEYGIPMRARMIHNLDGSTYPVPYGKDGQAIYSVGRRYVNEILLDAGEKYPNLRMHFKHRLTSIDIDEAKMVFSNQGQEVKSEADFILGCDGAFSTVRKALMRRPWFNYKQEYIPHAYLELCIPATEDNDFAMPANYLHIWPRGQFMMIGLPNQDKSFTMTLFMPKSTFDGITNGTDLLNFFEEYYADSIPLIGKDRLVQDYFSIKPSPLISIKCFPYHWMDKCLILGDAAHAMVPFYGQGMNCGMEDVLVFEDMMSKYPNDRKKAFEEYSKFRNPDAEAMCDLAMYNYIEMRDLTARTSFLLRKKLDNFLYWLTPSFWIPLYTSVTFTRMRYHLCIQNKKWQDECLDKIGNSLFKTTLAMGLASLIWYKSGQNIPKFDFQHVISEVSSLFSFKKWV